MSGETAKLQSQFLDCLDYYKTGRHRDAVAGFKYCQQRARELLTRGNADSEKVALYRRIEVESARNKGHAYMSLFKKEKAYASFNESLVLARTNKDRIGEAHALVGMSRSYEQKGLDDCTKADYAQQAHAIADAVYTEALTRFKNEGPPIMLPPFSAGDGPMLNTLRNKLYVGEVSERSDLANALAEAQSLLTLTHDAFGKARKGAA